VRKPVPDIMKGIAVLLMIQVHLMELLAKLEIYQGWGGKISLFLGGPPAAPVFMAIMGYFLLQSNKTVLQLLKRGVILIGLGFLLNILLNASAYIKIFSGKSELNPAYLLFGADILFLAGLSIILVTLVQKTFNRWFWAYLLLAIFVAVLSFFIKPVNLDNSFWAYPLAFIGGNYTWSYFPIVPWLSYVLIGVWFSYFEKRYLKTVLKTGKLLFISFFTFVFLSASIIYAFAIATDLPAYYHHNLIFFLWVCVFLVFYSSVIALLFRLTGESIFSKALCWVGENLTSIYIIQWIIIGNLATFLYKSQDEIQLSFWYIGITACTLGLISLYRYFRNIQRKNMVM
jgi:uncharacterized membrane protein